MSELVTIGKPGGGDGAAEVRPESQRRPPWLRVKIQDSEGFKEIDRLVGGLALHTVCQEARCPNIWECWGKHRTATFMILGDICTKACRYCSVTKSRRPLPPDPAEPEHVADAVAHLSLTHAVITSVDRDDLADYGAGHWVAVIEAIRRKKPDCRVELLTPDFWVDESALLKVLRARPEVFGHNTETVPRLYPVMRKKGSYERAMKVIARLDRFRREEGVPMTVKSGLMVGLGEEVPEILGVMDDLRAHGCDVLTLGQYLNPTRKHAPVAKFYTPDEFAALRVEALRRGFKHVVAGPLVRSSYHAHEHVPGAPAASPHEAPVVEGHPAAAGR